MAMERLTGMWKPRTESKLVIAGSCSKKELREALAKLEVPDDGRVRFMVFRNDRRESASSPDFTLCVDRDDKQQEKSGGGGGARGGDGL